MPGASHPGCTAAWRVFIFLFYSPLYGLFPVTDLRGAEIHSPWDTGKVYGRFDGIHETSLLRFRGKGPFARFLHPLWKGRPQPHTQLSKSITQTRLNIRNVLRASCCPGSLVRLFAGKHGRAAFVMLVCSRSGPGQTLLGGFVSCRWSRCCTGAGK